MSDIEKEFESKLGTKNFSGVTKKAKSGLSKPAIFRLAKRVAKIFEDELDREENEARIARLHSRDTAEAHSH